MEIDHFENWAQFLFSKYVAYLIVKIVQGNEKWDDGQWGAVNSIK